MHDDRQLAEETLSYIRHTMENASTFTAVSGWGLVAVGGVGMVAAWLAHGTGVAAPLNVWLPAAVVALGCSAAANGMKAKRLAVPLWSGSFRKMVWGLVPALMAGALLTYALGVQNAGSLIPGTWLAVYGAGVAASGMFSVRALRWMGLVMLGLGAVALVQPANGLLLLALGFGGVHVLFGAYIVHRHDG